MKRGRASFSAPPDRFCFFFFYFSFFFSPLVLFSSLFCFLSSLFLLFNSTCRLQSPSWIASWIFAHILPSHNTVSRQQIVLAGNCCPIASLTCLLPLPWQLFPSKTRLSTLPLIIILDRNNNNNKNGFQPPIRVPRVPPAIDLETFVSSVFASLLLFLLLTRRLSLWISAISYILGLREKVQDAFLCCFLLVGNPASWELTVFGGPQRMLISKDHFADCSWFPH